MAWGNTQLGHCDDSIKIDCGNWCIVDPGKCPGKQFYWHAMEKYISCSPCDNTRSLPALRKAECPAEDKDTGNGSPRLIGAGIGLLAAGIYWSLLLF